MNILMLAPNQRNRWNPGHQLFRDAIGEQHNTVYYGDGFPLFKDLKNLKHVPTILRLLKERKNFIPDVIATYSYKYSVGFRDMIDVPIPKMHFICDFTPFGNGWSSTIPAYQKMLEVQEYQLYFALSYQVIQWFKKNMPHIPCFYLPFGVDEKYFHPSDEPPIHGVYVGWSRVDKVYPRRMYIEELIKSRLDPKNYFIGRKYNQAYVKATNRSRISVNAGNVFVTMNMKYFEVMACRSLLFTDRVKEFTDLGYVDGKHYVGYHWDDRLNVSRNFVNLLQTCLEYPALAREIANEGYKYTIENHTNFHRVREMTGYINEVL